MQYYDPVSVRKYSSSEGGFVAVMFGDKTKMTYEQSGGLTGYAIKKDGTAENANVLVGAGAGTDIDVSNYAMLAGYSGGRLRYYSYSLS